MGSLITYKSYPYRSTPLPYTVVRWYLRVGVSAALAGTPYTEASLFFMKSDRLVHDVQKTSAASPNGGITVLAEVRPSRALGSEDIGTRQGTTLPSTCG